MKRVLSGIQPSGSLHIGNYFGMMNRMIKYQDENELFSCIVNYHALTTITDPEVLRKNTINATLDFFASDSCSFLALSPFTISFVNFFCGSACDINFPSF